MGKFSLIIVCQNPGPLYLYVIKSCNLLLHTTDFNNAGDEIFRQYYLNFLTFQVFSSTGLWRAKASIVNKLPQLADQIDQV